MKGNQQKMREALVAIKEVAERDMRLHVSMSESDEYSIRSWSNLFVSLADSALSSPPRNCDVGTAEDQTRRFHSYCINHRNACSVGMECCRCPLKKVKARCDFAWAQMPYEAQEGDGK